MGLATDTAGNVYVADSDNNRVQVFTSSGSYLTQWGSLGSSNGQFSHPVTVGTDVDGNVYVIDYSNHRIQIFTSSGSYLTQWGSFGDGNGQFHGPAGVAIDAAGNIYVADLLNHRIQKFGYLPTPASSSTWGRMKDFYRK
jgi:tripartite motif-containing protein 71